MTYLEIIYENALKLIGDIYIESKYNKDVDLYRSFDVINSLNETQLKGKQWLVDTLVPFLNKDLKDIIILGSWYGLNGMLIRQKIDNDIKIWNVDSDPLCKEMV